MANTSAAAAAASSVHMLNALTDLHLDDSRCFAYTEVTPPVDADGKLKIIKQSITNVIKPTIERVDKTLHQRRAQMGSIAKTHTAWSEELEALGTLFESHKKTLEGILQQLHGIQSPRQICKTFRKVVRLWMRRYLLKCKNTELYQTLRNEHHQKISEFCKIKVQQCEALYKANRTTTTKAKLQEFNTIINDTKTEFKNHKDKLANESISPVATQEIELLFEHLIIHLRYFYAKLPMPIPAEAEDLHKTAGTELNELVLKYVNREAEAKAKSIDKDAEERIVGPYKDDVNKLPSEWNFRTGQWFASWVWSEVMSEVERVTLVLSGIYMLSEDIPKRLTRLVEGKFSTDISHAIDKLRQELQAFDHLLIKIRCDLEQTAYSDHKHSGFDYIYFGRGQILQLRAYLNDLDLKINGDIPKGIEPFLPFAEAVLAFSYCFDPKEPAHQQNAQYLQSREAIGRLYIAMKLSRDLVRPSTDDTSLRKLCTLIYDPLHRCIGRFYPEMIGTLTQVMPGIEDPPFLNILVGRPLDNSLYESFFTQLVSWLTRKLILAPLMGPGRETFDPALDLVLAILNTQKYRQSFVNNEVLDPGVKNTVADYKKVSDYEKCDMEPLIELVRTAYAEPVNQEAVFYQKERLWNYCLARMQHYQLTLADRSNMSVQHRRRYDFYVDLVQRKLDTIGRGYPQSFADVTPFLPDQPLPKSDSTLFKALCWSIWGKAKKPVLLTLEQQPQEQTEQKDPRLGIFLTTYLTETTADGIATLSQEFQLLFYRWLIERFLNPNLFITHNDEARLLTPLMRNYLNLPHAQKLWRSIFSVGHMEIALKKVLFKESPQNDVVSRALRVMRGDDKEDFARWSQIVEKVEALHSLIKEQVKEQIKEQDKLEYGSDKYHAAETLICQAEEIHRTFQSGFNLHARACQDLIEYMNSYLKSHTKQP